MLLFTVLMYAMWYVSALLELLLLQYYSSFLLLWSIYTHMSFCGPSATLPVSYIHVLTGAVCPTPSVTRGSFLKFQDCVQLWP